MYDYFACTTCGRQSIVNICSYFPCFKYQLSWAPVCAARRSNCWWIVTWIIRYSNNHFVELVIVIKRLFLKITLNPIPAEIASMETMQMSRLQLQFPCNVYCGHTRSKLVALNVLHLNKMEIPDEHTYTNMMECWASACKKALMNMHGCDYKFKSEVERTPVGWVTQQNVILHANSSFSFFSARPNCRFSISLVWIKGKKQSTFFFLKWIPSSLFTCGKMNAITNIPPKTVTHSQNVLCLHFIP